MRRLVISAFLAPALLAPAGAQAANRYLLKHPKHEHCKAHYVRHVKRVHGKRRVYCVHVAPTKAAPIAPPTPAPAPVSARVFKPTFLVVSTSPTPASEPRYFAVAAMLYAIGELTGQPINYTIRDTKNGQTVATFAGLSGLSNGHAACTVVYKVEGGVQTWTGQAVAPDPGCALGTVTLSASDRAVLLGSFAGGAGYAGSASASVAFGLPLPPY